MPIGIVFPLVPVEGTAALADAASVSRIGLTPDQLVATWSPTTRRSYAARIPGLNILQGETVALVGTGTQELLDTLADALPVCTVIDGATAAAGGTLRIHAQQAARVGVQALAITDPFADLGEAATALAVADLAGLTSLGVTSVVVASDVDLAAAFADRVAVVHAGVVTAAYPVVAPAPRLPTDIAAVSQRVTRRLTAAAIA